MQKRMHPLYNPSRMCTRWWLRRVLRPPEQYGPQYFECERACWTGVNAEGYSLSQCLNIGKNYDTCIRPDPLANPVQVPTEACDSYVETGEAQLQPVYATTPDGYTLDQCRTMAGCSLSPTCPVPGVSCDIFPAVE